MGKKRTGSEPNLSRSETKKRMVEAMGSCCQMCGYDRCAGAMEFHHVDPTTKRFNFSQMIWKRFPWRVIVAELRKAVLLCSNCHREVHLGFATLPEGVKRFDERFANQTNLLKLK